MTSTTGALPGTMRIPRPRGAERVSVTYFMESPEQVREIARDAGARLHEHPYLVGESLQWILAAHWGGVDVDFTAQSCSETRSLAP